MLEIHPDIFFKLASILATAELRGKRIFVCGPFCNMLQLKIRYKGLLWIQNVPQGEKKINTNITQTLGWVYVTSTST